MKPRKARATYISSGSFVLMEINKCVEPEKKELYNSTEELKTKYLPGFLKGPGHVQPMLVFFHDGKIVRFNA